MWGVKGDDFIGWSLVIYCVCVGAQLTTLSGWWAPYGSEMEPFLLTGLNLNPDQSAEPVANIFGWELVKALSMILGFTVLAPIQFIFFLTQIFPPWLDFLAYTVGGVMGVVFYVGVAMFFLRLRSPI